MGTFTFLVKVSSDLVQALCIFRPNGVCFLFFSQCLSSGGERGRLERIDRAQAWTDVLMKWERAEQEKTLRWLQINPMTHFLSISHTHSDSVVCIRTVVLLQKSVDERGVKISKERYKGQLLQQSCYVTQTLRTSFPDLKYLGQSETTYMTTRNLLFVALVAQLFDPRLWPVKGSSHLKNIFAFPVTIVLNNIP